MTNFENAIKTIINGDERAMTFFNQAIEAQRMANWVMRNAGTEADNTEAMRHHEHYKEDMRYVARRIANITGFQHGLVCDALLVIATEEIQNRGELNMRTL